MPSTAAEHQQRTHLLHFQVDGPDDQVVGRVLTRQVHVVLQEALAVIKLLQHAVLLDVLLVLFDEVAHTLLLLFLGHVVVLPLRLGVDDRFGESVIGDGVHIPGHHLEIECAVTIPQSPVENAGFLGERVRLEDENTHIA